VRNRGEKATFCSKQEKRREKRLKLFLEPREERRRGRGGVSPPGTMVGRYIPVYMPPSLPVGVPRPVHAGHCSPR